jgi:hypothetical protein
MINYFILFLAPTSDDKVVKKSLMAKICPCCGGKKEEEPMEFKSESNVEI